MENRMYLSVVQTRAAELGLEHSSYSDELIITVTVDCVRYRCHKIKLTHGLLCLDGVLTEEKLG